MADAVTAGRGVSSGSCPPGNHILSGGGHKSLLRECTPNRHNDWRIPQRGLTYLLRGKSFWQAVADSGAGQQPGAARATLGT